jgi:hypothetical protein
VGAEEKLEVVRIGCPENVIEFRARPVITRCTASKASKMIKSTNTDLGIAALQ